MKSMYLRILPVLMIVSLLLGACSSLPAVPIVLILPSATPESSATSVPRATLAPSETPTPPMSDEVWDRIVANHKIIVGVDWDYPPFAYIDSNFQVVGFDVALSEEIGRRLNIPVEIQNFNFEALPNALQINQVDLAIAAISITPERADRMSFSPIYYVNQTAVLARNGSQVSITDFKQLAGFRVGVRRGTVYESMVQSLLVDTKLMSAGKFFRYMKVDEAIRDLVAKRVDLVVTGQATARYFSAQQGLKIAGKGFEQQDLAVAMRLGTPRLKAEIDRVMDDMLTDGTMLSLIQQYIQADVTEVLPTPTPTNRPTATEVPLVPTATPPACLDGMKFVTDVTYADNNMKNPPYIKPGDGFVKTWRVENTGTCTWTPNYQLTYAYGNVDAAEMSGQPLNIPGNVAPGQVIDLSVTMVAPQELLTYQGFWQMENAGDERFGQTIWVGISTQHLSGNYCQVTLTSPNKSIKIHSSFDTIWTVKNISGEDWALGSVDYKFISGTEMHENALYDLAQTVKDGESVQIIVDMVAPATPGIYNNEWAIVTGSRTLCTLTMSVTVVPK